MKERPISFRKDMITAILEGRKTQTRRVIKPQPTTHGSDRGWYADLYNHGPEWAFWLPDHRMSERRTWACPYWQPGDRLWTKNRRYQPKVDADAWLEIIDVRVERAQDITSEACYAEGCRLQVSKATQSVLVRLTGKHPPTDYLPKGALTEPVGEGFADMYIRAEFAALWDSINAKHGFSWGSNPWVWVVSFKRVER